MLHLQSISGTKSPEALRTALASLTTKSGLSDYDQAYIGVMQRIEGQVPDQASLASQVLSYVALARRPLTVAALLLLVAMDADSTPHMVDIMAACLGLVLAVGYKQHGSEQDGIYGGLRVQLVHCTAHEYLVRMRERWFPEGEERIASACVAYLSLQAFQGGPCPTDVELERRLRTYPLYRYAALHWGYHARVALLRQFGNAESMDFSFLSSLPHIESACQALFTAERHTPRGEYYSKSFPRRMSGLHLAGYFGITNLMHALPIHDGAVNAKDSYGRTTLAWAAREGHDEAVELILETAAVDLDTRDSWARTPVSLAAENGHTAIVELLLSRGANANLKDFMRATPLWYAVQAGHITVAELLVRRGVDVNVTGAHDHRYDTLHTPLSLAAMQGYDAIVRLLLAQETIQPLIKAKTREFTHGSCTPLWLAVTRGHENIVEMLLTQASVNPTVDVGYDGTTLLHEAARMGHEQMVRTLLINGADVNAQTVRGSTPLKYATDNGVVALLLSQAGVEPDLADDEGTPASSAASGGNTEILRQLLRMNVNLEAKDKWGHSLLSKAAMNGHEPVVELLLATDGVDANSRDHQGRTPLSLATSDVLTFLGGVEGQDRQGVVRRLLDSNLVDPRFPRRVRADAAVVRR